MLFIERNRPRVIGNGHVWVHRSLTRPFIEGGVKRRQLLYIVPDGLENGQHDGVGYGLGRGQADVVRDEAGVLHNRPPRPSFAPTRIIPGAALPQSLLAFW